MDQEVGTTKQAQEPGTIQKDQEVGGEVKSAADVTNEIEELRSRNERLENESKKYKVRFDRVQESEAKLQKLEQEKLDRDGNAEEKVDFYKKQNEALGEKYAELKTKVIMGDLKEKFRSIAPDCRKVDLVINNPIYDSEINAAINKDDMSIDEDILKSIYAKDKESNYFLYGEKKVSSMVGGDSQPDRKKSDSKKAIDKMTPDEYKEHILKTS